MSIRKKKAVGPKRYVMDFRCYVTRAEWERIARAIGGCNFCPIGDVWRPIYEGIKGLDK